MVFYLKEHKNVCQRTGTNAPDASVYGGGGSVMTVESVIVVITEGVA